MSELTDKRDFVEVEIERLRGELRELNEAINEEELNNVNAVAWRYYVSDGFVSARQGYARTWQEAMNATGWTRMNWRQSGTRFVLNNGRNGEITPVVLP